MKRRAVRLVEGLNALEGVSCNRPQGAMYVFSFADHAAQCAGRRARARACVCVCTRLPNVAGTSSLR
jgi:aspartate/methionine/tyrosine aminotransferase